VLGGSVTAGNVAAALGAADAVIVSTALMREAHGPDDLLRWDADLAQRFMDAARAAPGRG
jgi:predicted TIM-barrel enzyme